MAEGELFSIATLIWDYASKGKEIDKYYVERIVEIVKNVRNLQKLIQHIHFTDREDTLERLASYEAAWKMLHINLNKMKTEEMLPFSKTNRDFENKRMGYYLENTKDLLHALEHVSQYKKCTEKGEEMETKILNLSYHQIFNKWEHFREKHNNSTILVEVTKLYSMHHIAIHNAIRSIAPFERLAEIKAIEFEENLANVLELPFLLDYASFKKLEMSYLAHYYYDAPTIYYLNQHGIYKRAEKILEEGRELELEDRLTFGLPITKEEHSSIKKELIKMRSRLEKRN